MILDAAGFCCDVGCWRDPEGAHGTDLELIPDTGALLATSPTATGSLAVTKTIGMVLVAAFGSMNRPGGNITGVTGMGAELGQKQLELLHELVPTTTVVAALINPISPTAEALSSTLQAAARVLGLQLHILNASTEPEIDAAFASLGELRAGALVIAADVFFTTRSKQLAALTLGHALPSIYLFREFAAAGGLMSYGTSNVDAYHQIGVYTGRILNGEKPADLPVVQSTKVELVLNLKTAKTLGLTVPLTLLGRADEVIE
jgi:putative ABC transport system substrate-binding protein